MSEGALEGEGPFEAGPKPAEATDHDAEDRPTDGDGLLAIVALGSNLDDPLNRLRAARDELASIGTIVSASGLYRTAPVGGPPGQPDFLNAVVAFRPAPRYQEPKTLLRELLAIERRHGRRRRVRWEARVLDLDLLDVGRVVIEEEALVLPHPRMMERAFVLAPLCEALPGWSHPLTGEGACQALARLGRAGVERTELDWDGGEVTR